LARGDLGLMNYDETDIALNYDRGRDHGSEVADLWMNRVSAHVNGGQIETILDLGCGTGRFSEALAAHFDAHVIGIDPSKKMLEQAERKRRDPRVRYESGSGESIPLPNHSVDLIFMSMVFHHFKNPIVAARECRRVLRKDGTCFMRTGTFERIELYPYVEFFPATRPILEDCLPSAAFVREVFAAAEFREEKSEVVTQEIAQMLEAYGDKLAAGADSILIQLSSADFAAGMQALRSHAIHSHNHAVVEPIDVFVFR
jgi:ubiquinone/menaquinone biosynthesis C-methylase UbiE